MNAIVLLTHAPLGHALKESLRHVLGEEVDCVRVIDVTPHDQPDHVIAKECPCLNEIPKEQGILILADIVGATPCNIAKQMASRYSQARLIAGVNIPMLIKSITHRHDPMPLMIEHVMQAAVQGVINIDLSCPS